MFVDFNYWFIVLLFVLGVALGSFGLANIFIAFFEPLTRNKINRVFKSVISIVLLAAVFFVICPLAFKDTDRISDANSINQDDFVNKIVEVSEIDSLSSNSRKEMDSVNKYSSIDLDSLKKGDYITLTGVNKHDEDVTLRISFKQDKMIVKTSVVSEKDSIEVHEYNPK